MKTAEKSLTPAVAIHPGEHLSDELDARGISQIEFAKMIGYQKSQLNEVIKGKRGINAELALLLQSSLDIDASFWLNLQKNFELDSARIEAKNRYRLEALELWRMIKECIPVTFFKKSGIIFGDPVEDIPVIKQLYGIQNLDQLAVINASPAFAHFRKSQKSQLDKSHLVGWFKLCEFKAKNLIINKFDHSLEENLMKDLCSILYENKNVLKMIEQRLAEAGIKFIIQEKGEKMPIDGVAFWSNGNPAIALSLRFNRIDWLAFTLFHELGHVFLHLVNNNQAILIDLDKADPDYQNGKEEIEADGFAQEHLIRQDAWEKFHSSYTFGDSQILSFAKAEKVHPAIVLGRLCHESGNYKVRSSIDRVIL